LTNASILKAKGLKAKKSFGQNFLEDRTVLERIADLCEITPQQNHVLEIGAGLGALTAVLADRGAHVVAIERDRDLAPLLRARFQDKPAVEVMEANALVMDLPSLAARAGSKLTVCGNLPYNLTSPLIFRALAQIGSWHRLVVMVQKEVADRMVAAPGNRTFGLLSVMLRGQLQVRSAFDVPPHAFHPRPKVWSSMVVMTPRETPVDGAMLPTYGRVAKAAFAGRRKTIRNGLKPLFDNVDAVLADAGIDPGIRAETLDIDVFGRLAIVAARHGLKGADVAVDDEGDGEDTDAGTA
jgi:16S rRNA (adenine1518-N6/adenine1519-N6)-dimethyltransferase